jgi:heme-degrading monooxygenase HmoA
MARPIERPRRQESGGYAMIVTVFRKRMNPNVQGEYDSMAGRMSELARAIPGYISHKGFVAADGEQVTIVEFESEEALQKWRIDPDHRMAKKRGIESFFSEYKVQICNVIRERAWAAKATPGAPGEPHSARSARQQV